jgi:hypothetical protein
MQQVMHLKGVLTFLLICLVLTPFVSAVPLKAASFTDDGLVIISPAIDYKTLGQSFNQNVHVINKSNGAILTNSHVTCVYHLYNESGEHITLLNMTYQPTEVEWEAVINADNFSYVGQYSRIIICNYTHGSFLLGDASEFHFFVTESGNQDSSEWIIIAFMLLFLVFSIGYMITIVMIIEDFGTANINAYGFVKYLGMYLAMIGFYYFNQQFVHIVMIENVISMLIKVGLYTHGIVPAFGFGYSLIINKIKDANTLRMGG